MTSRGARTSRRTATKAAPAAVAAPAGLRVSEKLLNDYRARCAALELDELDHERIAERLEWRILKASELFPWTPAAIFSWVFAWLHALGYGAKATTHPFKGFYGESWDDVAWVLQYDDIEKVIEELDEDDKRRHRGLS